MALVALEAFVPFVAFAMSVSVALTFGWPFPPFLGHARSGAV